MARDPALDGLRGIAIALVLALHQDLLPGGWIGVSLFFTLSGYLITSLLLAEHESSGSIALGAFYRRRAARLGPALILALLGMCVVGVGLGYGRLALVDSLVALLYLVNLARALWPAPLTPVSWGWTLSLEEQFYALWPPLLRRALHRGVTRQRCARALLLGAAGVAVARLVLAGHEDLVYTLLRGDELLLGAALALVPVRCPRWLTWLALACSAVLLALPFPTALAFTVTAASLCAVVVVASADNLRLALELPPLRYLGRISYGLYLWNGVLVAATPLHLSRVLYLVVPVGLAVASTHLVEEPLRRRLARPRNTAQPVSRAAPPLPVG